MDPELSDTRDVVDSLRRYEEEVRAEFETLLETESARHEDEERWPFAGGWYTRAEIRRLRRRSWLRWWVVRLEAVILIGLGLVLALGVFLVLNQLLPK